MYIESRFRGFAMVTVKEAQNKILDVTKPLSPADVALAEATGLVLVEGVKSPIDLPLFDNSAMDGFAVKEKDIRTASPEGPVTLKVVLDLVAGDFSTREIKNGEAARIMTGAPLPPGTDAVVRVEDTDARDEEVAVKIAVSAGKNIRWRGEDVARESEVLPAAKKLTPGDIGLLAAIGKGSVLVYPRPKVAVISTGDELEEPGQTLGPGKIYNSNAYMLSSLLAYHGAIPKFLGIARDNPDDLREKLKKAAAFDLILTSGGVSVGVHDLVKNVLAEMGDIFFWKVAIRPGKPLAFGLLENVPLLGLPGNPGASFVSFYQFVLPAIRKLAGRRDALPHTKKARLEETLKKRKGFLYCLKVVLSEKNGEITARLSGGQSSGMLLSTSTADALALLPEDREIFHPGEEIEVQLLYS